MESRCLPGLLSRIGTVTAHLWPSECGPLPPCQRISTLSAWYPSVDSGLWPGGQCRNPLCVDLWYLALSGLLGDHQGDAGGEAVQEVLRTHGADLAVAEEACRGDRPQEVRQRPSVVIRRPEQADAATVAGTQQRPNGLARAELRPHSLE